MVKGGIILKSWDVIKAWSLNSKRRFKNLKTGEIWGINSATGNIIEYSNYGVSCGSRGFDIENINDDWEEVKVPVDWKTAFEHWLNGGGFELHYNEKVYTNSSNFRLGGFDEFGDVYGFRREMLNEGRFYLIY